MNENDIIQYEEATRDPDGPNVDATEEDGNTSDSATVLPPADPPGGDGRHLSWFRVGLVFVVVAALIYGGWYFRQQQEAVANAPVPTAAFAPYVDVTATPTYPFENTVNADPTSVVLAFIVSAKSKPCEPSWGGAYTMADAGDQLELDRRVARLRQLDGQVTISFGGAANSELAIGCKNPADLAAAYQSVIDRYQATEIDLDVEGSAASAADVNQRRAAAMATVTAKAKSAGKPLAIWLTLPVGQNGLTAEGLGVLNSMISAKVPLAGVNGMTMDYGEPLPAGRTMAQQGELALNALQAQIKTAYSTAGTDLTDLQAWQLVGATPMIGQNDIPDEVFTLDDAQQLVQFAQQVQLARLSMWSANRDQSCGPNYPDVKVVSDACSGISQTVGQFTSILRTFGADTGATPTAETTAATNAPATASTGASPTAVTSGTEIVDDPAKSPYQIWNPNQAYTKGTKVVWHRNVYQAKYYTVGDMPDTPVATADQTPWTLIGPVLPGDTPAPTPTLPAGTYPEWDPKTVYQAGSRVLQDGIGWQAKYWTQGDRPGAIPTSPTDDSPWVLLQAPK
jgi:chitinase